jgi:hypothetical protein
MKRSAIALALAALGCAGIGAQTVSVHIFEEGRTGTPPDPLIETILSGAMDETFAQGFIATSEKPSVISRRSFEAWSEADSVALKAALVDCILVIIYRKDTFGRPGVTYPGQLEFYLRDVVTGKLLYQGEIPGMKSGDVSAGGRDAVLKYCMETGVSIARECLGALR